MANNVRFYKQFDSYVQPPEITHAECFLAGLLPPYVLDLYILDFDRDDLSLALSGYPRHEQYKKLGALIVRDLEFLPTHTHFCLIVLSNSSSHFHLSHIYLLEHPLDYPTVLPSQYPAGPIGGMPCFLST